jgi:hypothetical protein
MEADAAARGDLSTWLLAVGNAAPPETFSIARRCLVHADAAVRGSACVALLCVTDAAVVPLLVDLGLADAEATVRREALLVLGRRSEPARAAIERIARIAQGDANEELRNKANELLRAWA